MTATASIVEAIKRRTPTALYPLARSVYHRVVAPIEMLGRRSRGPIAPAAPTKAECCRRR